VLVHGPAPGPIDIGEQQQRCWGRNVVERWFTQLTQWQRVAMRSDPLLPNYRAGITLTSILIWITIDLINTA